MDTGTRLHEAILEDPLDDAPRLMYADWLEEQGEAARARFIRDQVKYPGNMATSHKQMRGNILNLTNQKPWLMEFRRITTPSVVLLFNAGESWVRFRRGFVEDVGTTLHELVYKGEIICRAHPVTTMVDVRSRRANLVSEGRQRINMYRKAIGLPPLKDS